MNALGQATKAAWARVRLLRGQSAGGLWEIDANYPQARLSVGSAPDAGWPIMGPAVAPVHFEIFWDGASLWIADTRQVGGVELDGRPVTEWVQVQGRAEVSFGGAAVQVETSGPQAQAMASSPGAAQRVSAPPQWDDVSLSGEATRVATAPSELALDAESTRIAPPSAPIGRPPTPPPAERPTEAPAEVPGFDAMRPRLGGSPAAPRAEATRIASMPDNPPGVPATAPARSDGPTQASIEIQPGYPSAPTLGGAATGAAPPPSIQLASPGPQAPGPGGFAAPPSFDEAHANSQAKGKGKQSLPTRTWIMLAVTVIAAAALIILGPAQEEVATAAPQAGVPQPIATPGTATPATTPGTATPGTATPDTATSGTATSGTATPGTATPPTPATPTAGTTDTPGSPTTAEAAPPARAIGPDGLPIGPTDDRLAADMVVNGRFAEALARYEAMAAAHPERPVYATMVRVLRQKLGGCPQGGIGADGRPCVVTR